MACIVMAYIVMATYIAMAYTVIVGWACSMLLMAQGITFIGGGGGGGVGVGVGWACPAADGAEHNLYCGGWPVLPPGGPYGFGPPSFYIVMAIAT